MAVPNKAARRPRPPRRRYAALAVTGVAAALTLLPTATVEAAETGHAAPPAAAAVRALTAPGPVAAAPMPDDFADVAGYRPARTDGMLVAPHGSCSSPVPLPVEFDTACKAHDLGYDLLRYAGHDGRPLGSWARRDLDRVLADRMRATCTDRRDPLSRTRCAAMAEVAAVAVDLNSRRQSYGVPVVEHFSLADTATTWLPRIAPPVILFAALLLARGATRPGLPTGAAGRRPHVAVPFTAPTRELSCTH